MHNAICSLKLLFGKHFQKATSVIDQNGVTGLIGKETDRRLYQVKGHRSQDSYVVFPGHYCSCQSFFYDIATKSEGIYVRVY